MRRFVDYGNVYPVAYYYNNLSGSNDRVEYDNNTSITLSPSTPTVTLDYGTEVAGFPFLRTTTGGFTSYVEAKYAESLASLSNNNADGPWTFSNGLANSFRVETFETSNSSYLESFFVQGGQRWQSLRLLGNQSITVTNVGFRATSQHTDVDKLPTYMTTSNAMYNKILDLGGRVAQVACVDAGNAPSTWELTDEGVLVRGQTTAQSAKGILMKAANYTIEFSTKILRGGTGWRIASDIAPSGPLFVFTSDYPDNNTPSNTNRTLLPPNNIIFNSGWSIVNQSTLETPANSYFSINTTLQEGTWYRISTSIEQSGYRIRLDGNEIAFVPLPPPSENPRFSSPSRYEGTWGFGGFQDHISMFANVSVKSQNGSQIYENNLLSEDILAEYGVAPLNHSICLDGAKRDRLLWIGDFYHTVRVLAQSSARWDYITGSLDYIFDYQVASGPYAGFVPISPGMGTRPEYSAADPGWEGLVDYQDLLLAGIGKYFEYTGDVEGLKRYWSNIKSLAEARMKFIDPVTGLVAGSSEVPNPFSFNGPANGSATSGMLAFALKQLVPVALALDEKETADRFTSTASKLIDTINDQLWNPSLGTYSLSLDSPGNFSYTGVAWCILAGAADRDQIQSSLAKIEELRFGAGYRTISSDAESPDYQLAPNPSGFLLEALLQAYHEHEIDSTTSVSHLLDGLWGSMVNDDNYYSGASWEYVKPDGSPGIDAFTSLAHPWGAAPTYVLPEYVLGIRPTTPGYKSFVVQPAIGFLGLEKAEGRVATQFGTINASWSVEADAAVIDVEVPSGATGYVKLSSTWKLEGSNNETGQVALHEGGNRLFLTLA
ncbi:unnamed protein product [Periconia digitata]|uniref:Alpha-L-rhamnosidase C-terminal domain-containing protein n=1 Tax=Periconia digitata TaxID=1303443 RepID=A0A9W4U2A1_9PLEO|nr:unnamed protein product [Periconia digitata]